DLQQNGDLMDVTHSTAPTMRVPPTQLRHAWNALTRSVLERAEGMPTSVFVRGVQCAGAVACVDTILCQQLLSFLVEFRRDELSLLDWTAILHTARQSFESRRIFEEYLQEPLTLLLLSMSKENGRGNALESQHVISSGKRLVDDLSLFVEALPELFTGDAEFWGLVRTALKVQWIAQFNAASSSEQHQQQLTLCLQDLARSYEWAVRTAGHHELGAIPIV
ncbi:mitochondrial 3' processome subunit 1, partial [Trypanosoma cruzi]